jgi:L-asparagine oxygenase
MTTMETRVRTFERIEIDDQARATLAAELVRISDPSATPERSLTVLHKIFATLPVDTLQSIVDFGRLAGTPGVALVDGLPVDPILPPTPDDGGPARGKRTYVSEGNLLGISGLLGEPTGVTTEKDGQIVHDVIPVASGATTQTNQGSKVFLNFHCDIIHDHSKSYTVGNPDFLVLMCVRPDPEGEAVTYYADARDISAALAPEHLEELRKPVFQLNAPGSYCRQVGAEQVLALPAPLISGPEEFPEIGISANGVIPMTTKATAALEALHVACSEVAHEVRLQAGQALLINNRKGCHARSQFVARHDGSDRWLQRSYVRRSIWTARYRLQPGTTRVL